MRHCDGTFHTVHEKLKFLERDSHTHGKPALVEAPRLTAQQRYSASYSASYSAVASNSHYSPSYSKSYSKPRVVSRDRIDRRAHQRDIMIMNEILTRSIRYKHENTPQTHASSNAKSDRLYTIISRALFINQYRSDEDVEAEQ